MYSDWLWEHSIIISKVHIPIENLEKWVELIYMGNSALGPFLAIILDPPLSFGLIHIPYFSMSP
jgi:hypothetical protein